VNYFILDSYFSQACVPQQSVLVHASGRLSSQYMEDNKTARSHRSKKEQQLLIFIAVTTVV
jgi:hypothetical protein